MKKITSTGAIVSSLFASACCLFPVILSGIAGIAGVASFLEGLRPLFLSIAVIFLGYGFYVAYLKKPRECREGEVCATAKGRHHQRIVLWIVTAFVVFISTFPYWIQFF